MASRWLHLPPPLGAPVLGVDQTATTILSCHQRELRYGTTHPIRADTEYQILVEQIVHDEPFLPACQHPVAPADAKSEHTIDRMQVSRCDDFFADQRVQLLGLRWVLCDPLTIFFQCANVGPREASWGSFA